MIAQLWRTAAQNYNCKKFFLDNTGPNEFKVMKGNDAHWLQLVTDAKKKLDLVTESAVITDQEKGEFLKPTMKAKKLVTDRAREALKRKASDLETRVRRVRIG